jgi:fucose 4-O-acetylase-like acetyltransferase
MKRLESIDRMKGIAILLVIVGHLIQFNGIDGGTKSKLFNIIYSFHMPLFFILSGYVASLGSSKILNMSSLGSFMLKKVYTLIIPLFTWELIVNKFFFNSSFELISVNDLLNVFLHPGLWFLQILFEIQILFSLYCLLSSYFNKMNKFYISILLFLLVYTLPVCGYVFIDHKHFMTLILFVTFFFVGSFVSKYPYLQGIIMNKYVFSSSFILFLVIVSHWSIDGDFVDDILKVVISIVAFISLLHLTELISYSNRIDSQIQLLGKESLAIYLIQFYLTAKLGFIACMTGYNPFCQFAILIGIAIFIAYICIFIHRQLEKSEILNFIFFGVKK